MTTPPDAYPADGDAPAAATADFNRVPVLPVRGPMVYPSAVVPLQIGQPRSLRLVEAVARSSQVLGVFPQVHPEQEQPGPDEVYRTGTLVRILQVIRRPDGGQAIVVEGLTRVRVVEWLETEPYVTARVEEAPVSVEDSPEVEALGRALVRLFRQIAELTEVPQELVTLISGLDDPLRVTYLVASTLQMNPARHHEFYALDSLSELLRWLVATLSHELEVLQIGRRIAEEARDRMGHAQREYVLREQLRAIQKELGEEDPEAQEVADLRRRLDEAAPPPDVRQEADRELARFAQLPAISPERGMVRNYLEWMVELPWQRTTGGVLDLPEARRILDADHYDLEKVKERILEYLAVRKFKEQRRNAALQHFSISAFQQEGGPRHSPEASRRGDGESPAETADAGSPPPLQEIEAVRGSEPILCFVGPPGVGKTSLGQSIARAMGRRFVRVALGGIRDEAEIRGHRRTYVGALPGRVLQAIRRAGAADTVFMLDEVDKLAVGLQGDPAAALLEVLDPAQNHTFTDLYLGVPFDLSRVMFICTANTTDTVPPALLDRMEVLPLAGYTEEEKLHIAERYLVPRQLLAHGLTSDDLHISHDALRRIIREYTREAGVRALERQIAAICRKTARELAEGGVTAVLTPPRLELLLGRPSFHPDIAERTERPGVATGLAWTPAGGDILFVEAAVLPGGDGRLILTGMLGDVMRESAQAAVSYVRSEAARLGLAGDALKDKDIHIHVPAGAVPKDGPSAGITIAAALASLLTGRPVRPTIGMTGEITLRGAVLPVGGVKEKVLAAHRAGLEALVLPRRNARDLEDVPPEVLRALQIELVDSVHDALAAVLSPPSPHVLPATSTASPPARRSRRAA